MPTPFEALLLALAAWRVWHLLAKDDLTEPLRDRLLKNDKALDFVECPYCLGFWISLYWVGLFAVWDTATVWFALPFSVNAAVIAVNHWLNEDE